MRTSILISFQAFKELLSSLEIHLRFSAALMGNSISGRPRPLVLSFIPLEKKAFSRHGLSIRTTFGRMTELV